MKDLFNIYYMNFNKTYEIKTMINNVITLTKEITNLNDNTEESNNKINILAELGLNIFHLFKSQAKLSDESKETKNSSNKILETFEIKITKSVILNEVLEKCKELNKEVKEGDLIKIDNVKLKVIDEDEHRMAKLIKSNIFKGLQIPEANGLDINNIFNSILSDYYYKITGTSNDNKDNNKLLFKIPISLENEFENNYSIDDLFIGKVSIIGVYKGKIKISELKSTFQYLNKKDNVNNTNYNYNLIYSSDEKPCDVNNNIEETSDTEYDFIDILAIIQIINTN